MRGHGLCEHFTKRVITTYSGAIKQSKFYLAIIDAVEPHIPNLIRPLWEHPAGPKTVFFWAPLFKWGLVFAGLNDLQRPVETLSMKQCSSLAVTGLIWSRWSLIIVPKNYSLFAVNFIVFLTQAYQTFRVAKLASLKRDEKSSELNRI